MNVDQAQFYALLNLIPTGVVVIDAQTHRILAANNAALEMLGRAEDEIVGAVCHRYICPAEEGKCPITDLGQTVDHSERVLLDADGQPVPIIKT
ncbi:MAG TPA: PAS domain-containing protein, partial [Anaerolineae bacterium]|nr:PAS domain-containing protein [Anaerolineae bacterium]